MNSFNKIILLGFCAQTGFCDPDAQCIKCNKRFILTKKELLGGVNPPCEDAMKRLESKPVLVKDTLTYHFKMNRKCNAAKVIMKCHTCHNKFSSIETLLGHLGSNSTDENVKAQYPSCPGTDYVQGNRKMPQKGASGNAQTAASCRTCGGKFSSRTLLFKHLDSDKNCPTLRTTGGRRRLAGGAFSPFAGLARDIEEQGFAFRCDTPDAPRRRRLPGSGWSFDGYDSTKATETSVDSSPDVRPVYCQECGYETEPEDDGTLDSVCPGCKCNSPEWDSTDANGGRNYIQRTETLIQQPQQRSDAETYDCEDPISRAHQARMAKYQTEKLAKARQERLANYQSFTKRLVY